MPPKQCPTRLPLALSLPLLDPTLSLCLSSLATQSCSTARARCTSLAPAAPATRSARGSPAAATGASSGRAPPAHARAHAPARSPPLCISCPCPLLGLAQPSSSPPPSSSSSPSLNLDPIINFASYSHKKTKKQSKKKARRDLGAALRRVPRGARARGLPLCEHQVGAWMLFVLYCRTCAVLRGRRRARARVLATACYLCTATTQHKATPTRTPSNPAQQQRQQQHSRAAPRSRRSTRCAARCAGTSTSTCCCCACSASAPISTGSGRRGRRAACGCRPARRRAQTSTCG